MRGVQGQATQATRHSAAALDYERRLLEFVAALLGRAQPALQPRQLSAQLWRETPPLLGQMYARAVLAQLVRDGGWRRRDCVERGQVRPARLWETGAFTQLELRFSAPLVRVCVELMAGHSALQSDQGYEPTPALTGAVAALASAGTAADHRLLYLLTRALSEEARCRPLVLALCEGVGLCQLHYGPRHNRHFAFDGARLRAALDAWAWTLPWTRTTLAQDWVEADALKFSRGLTFFRATVQRLQRTFEAVMGWALAAERHEALLAVLDFFKQAYGTQAQIEAALQPLAAMLEARRMIERQDVQDDWGSLLRLLGQLGRERRRIRATHPVDREPAEKLFIAAWQESDMDGVFEHVEALRVSLERVLG